MCDFFLRTRLFLQGFGRGMRYKLDYFMTI